MEAGDETEAETELTQEDRAEISDPILADMNILSYNTVDAALASSETSAKQFTKQFKKGEISQSFRDKQNTRIDRSFKVLNDYIKYYQQKSTKMGSGMRRKKADPSVFSPTPKNFFKNWKSSLAPFLLETRIRASETLELKFLIFS